MCQALFLVAVLVAGAPDPESAEAWLRQQAHEHRVLDRAMRRYEMRADGSVDGTLDGPTGLDADLLLPDFDDVESASAWILKRRRRQHVGAVVQPEAEVDEEAEAMQREQEDLLRQAHNDFDGAILW